MGRAIMVINAEQTNVDSSFETCTASVAGTALSVDAAVGRAVALAGRLADVDQIGLFSAAGRVLATAPVSNVAVPPFNNSAMDGYAVKHAMLTGSGPWRLPVLGTVAAGAQVAAPPAGEPGALRILTGARLPEGFDTVIMQERCERFGDRVTIAALPQKGENVRLAGEDVSPGKALLSPGCVLTPERLALLAGTGTVTVSVVRKLRVGVACTGSELRQPGEVLGPGQIYNSNGVMVQATLAAMGWIDLIDLGMVDDDHAAMRDLFAKAAGHCDVIVTTGGVSAGDEDHVAAAFVETGGVLDVMKVAMRPGKPVKIGRMGETLFAGLPGNPNAALVALRCILLPALRSMAGFADFHTRWSSVRLDAPRSKRSGRTEFAPFRTLSRSTDGLPVITLLGPGSSANLSALAKAEGLVKLPAGLALVSTDIHLDADYFPREI